MIWNAGKSAVIKDTNSSKDGAEIKLHGQIIKRVDGAEYFVVTASASGTKPSMNIPNIKRVIQLLQILKRNRVDSRNFNTKMMLRLWSTFAMPKATYSHYVVPATSSV